MGCLKLAYRENESFLKVVREDAKTKAESSINYFPFGMVMPGRSYVKSGGDYRFAFNGMEKDSEVNDTDNSYTTHFRMLDTRLGRWWSIDPKTKDSPMKSPYLTFSNTPTKIVDPRGDNDYIFDSEGNLIAYTLNNNEDRYFTQVERTEDHTHRAIGKDGEVSRYLTQIDNPDFAIIQIYVEKGTPAGHTGIATDGNVMNFYPNSWHGVGTANMWHLLSGTDDLKTLDKSVEMFMKYYPKTNIHFIKVTLDQKNILLSLYALRKLEIDSKKESGNEENYFLGGNNCTSNLTDMLVYSGVFEKKDLVSFFSSPRALNNNLKNFENKEKVIGSDLYFKSVFKIPSNGPLGKFIQEYKDKQAGIDKKK